jgi:hypothetical protein
VLFSKSTSDSFLFNKEQLVIDKFYWRCFRHPKGLPTLAKKLLILKMKEVGNPNNHLGCTHPNLFAAQIDYT